MTQMVEHHTHYKEIHGFDKTVMMTNADHQALHRRLRKEGKCNIPVDELTKISNRAHQRTIKYKEYAHHKNQEDYKNNKVNELKRSKQYYNENRLAVNTQRNKYCKNNLKSISFRDTLAKNIYHREKITYNLATGNVQIWCGFIFGGKYAI